MSIFRVEGQLGIGDCPIILAFSSRCRAGAIFVFAIFSFIRDRVPARPGGDVNVICGESRRLYVVRLTKQHGGRDMIDQSNGKTESRDKATVTLPGVVEKIIRSPSPDEPDKVQIAIEGADELYREIRVENTLHDPEGNPVSLKKGADIEVTVEADSAATTAKK
jgi:hypothetical protein